MFLAPVVWRIATDVSLTVLTLELFERLDTAGTEQFSKYTHSDIMTFS